MAARKAGPRSLLDQLEDPAHRRRLAALFPRKNRDWVRAIIAATIESRTNKADLCARYQERLAKSLQAEGNADTRARGDDPAKVFSIQTQGQTSYEDSELGAVTIRHFHYQEIWGPYFSGGLCLEGGSGGVVFVFHQGIPVNAGIRLYLNWSQGKYRAAGAPSLALNPSSIITGPQSTFGADFTWRVVRAQKSLILCVTPLLNTISFGADCWVNW